MKDLKLKKLIVYLSISLFAIYLLSCGRDEVINPPIVVNSSKGAYILSEGGFSAGTSKLSFYNRTKDSFYVNIFNPGALGITPDGITLDNNNIYLSEQGNPGSAGKIYKTDTNGTVIISANVGTNPYSLTIANNKIYLTNGPSNNVSVVDKNNLSTIKTIQVGLYPQEILAIGNKVFVCNTSLFTGETDSTISVIDAAIDQVVATIIVGKAPSSLAATPDDKLLVGCPGDSIKAVIYKIDPTTLNKLDSFTNLRYGFCKDISVISLDKINYIGGNIYAEADIVSYTFSTRTSSIYIPKPPSPAIFYGLAYDEEANLLYAGYVPSFSASGQFRIYNTTGTLQKNFIITNGIAPRRFAIKR